MSSNVHIIRQRFDRLDQGVSGAMRWCLLCTCGEPVTGRSEQAAERRYQRHILAVIQASRVAAGSAIQGELF